MKLEPFITPVNQAGLPISWETHPLVGNENITRLSPKEIAKLYWMLRSVRIEYIYSIGPYRHVRTLLLETQTTPKERILGPAEFNDTQDDEAHFLYQAELDLWEINRHMDIDNSYALYFRFSEYHYQKKILLSLEKNPALQVHDNHELEFFGRSLKLYLQSARETSGNIEAAHIECVFFDYL